MKKRGKQQGVENAFVDALAQTEFLEQRNDRLTFLSGARQPLLVWQPFRASGQAWALPSRCRQTSRRTLADASGMG
jgi:hypothetical protein